MGQIILKCNSNEQKNNFNISFNHFPAKY